jgi:hypothetical protein
VLKDRGQIAIIKSKDLPPIYYHNSIGKCKHKNPKGSQMLEKDHVLDMLSKAPDGSQAIFNGALIGALDFQNHVFGRPLNFSGAIFTGHADFSGTTFHSFANFDSTVFHKPASFRSSRFERGVQFSVASLQKADFFQTRVNGVALFWRTIFHQTADFSQMKVCRVDWESRTSNGELNFSWARFDEKAVFTYAEIDWPAYFHRTLFAGDVFFDQCIFHDTLYLYGKRNDVLFPRFGLIDPETVGSLEAAGIFRPDTERHRTYKGRRLSEFVLFNNVLTEADLMQKLEQLSFELLAGEVTAIQRAWREGARSMFAENHLVTFRGTDLKKLEQFTCKYVDTDNVHLDRDVAGPPARRKAFEAKLKADSFDLFLSHASEDKEQLARPLCSKLRELGYVVWLDESQIEAGDQLVQSLDSGIHTSRCGLIVLSQAFMRKKWTRYEVDQLLEASRNSGKKLFFLWHGVSEDEVRAWSPELADRVAFITERYSLDELALRLARAMR